MPRKTRNSNNQRGRGKENIPEQLNVDSESEQLNKLKTSKKTTILDVNDDCLVEIFMHLDGIDILNVAVAHKRFGNALDRVFIRRRLHNPSIVSNSKKQLKLSLNVLEQFGHLITSVTVFYKLHKFDVLMQAMVKYCGETITELHFRQDKDDSNTDYWKARQQLLNLSTKFPKLKSLAFQYKKSIDCPYSDAFIQPIPTLTAFRVYGLIFSHEDALKFITVNGQLELLGLSVPDGYITQSFITKIDSSLPNLQTLKLNIVEIEGTVEYPSTPPFINLRELFFGSLKTTDTFATLRKLFGTEIERFELSVMDYFIANFVENISQYKKLSVFTLHLSLDINAFLHRFDVSIFSSTTLRELILRNKQLTKLKIYWYGADENFDIYRKKFRDVVNENLNGARWCMEEKEYIMQLIVKEISFVKK
ncbi:uncharacterized protein LOC119078255 [Bradysia coprophila]|uniref:uncharacterized protein LOC119078255 n=1 Tax=Bradysia coprophila TaxID=38358 RepID=UPI00187DD74C|nr:uncharacterized protein LOC119078255 [Bradysia coprophila]